MTTTTDPRLDVTTGHRHEEIAARLRKLAELRTHRADAVEGIDARKQMVKAADAEIETISRELCRLGDESDDLAGMQTRLF